MIKPFKILNDTPTDGGMRRVEFSVRRRQAYVGGVRTLELTSAVFLKEDEDADAYILEKLKEQGWF